MDCYAVALGLYFNDLLTKLILKISWLYASIATAIYIPNEENPKELLLQSLKYFFATIFKKIRKIDDTKLFRDTP